MRLKAWLNLNKGIFTERDLKYLMRDVFLDCRSTGLEENVVMLRRQRQRLEEIKKLYLTQMPLPYILGKEEFFGIEFKVNCQVLIPRKETELIVEEAIKIAQNSASRYILDLCCGCANISVSIKKFFYGSPIVFAADISLGALMAAQENIKVYDRDIKLVRSDLFEGIKFDQFDLIVANPPYVESGGISGPLRYEPRVALDGGADGLCLISRILDQAYLYLRKNSFLIMEIGYNQKEAIRGLVEQCRKYEIIKWIKDYDNNCRGIVLKRG